MILGHRRRHRTAPAGVLALALALAGPLALGGCSSSGADGSGGTAAAAEPRLRVSDAFVPQPVMADMAGGFLVVENSGEQDDTLTEVTSDIADRVELHETAGRQMQRVASFPVPAGGELAFRRGGNHLMLRDLERKPVEGDEIALKLHFAKHDPITVSVPVEAANHTGDAGHAGSSPAGSEE